VQEETLQRQDAYEVQTLEREHSERMHAFGATLAEPKAERPMHAGQMQLLHR
jgi:hypothetical protein